MHKTVVWTASAALGISCCTAVHVIAPLTASGFLICAFLSTVVAAYGMGPSLTLRRLSIRLRHLIRKHRLRLARRRQVIGTNQRQMKLLVVGTCAFVGALGIQQALLASSQGASLFQTTPSLVAIPTSLATDVTHIARHAASEGVERPAPADTFVTETIRTNQPPTEAPIRKDPGDSERHDAAWAWLVDLLFLTDRPPA